MLSNRLDTAKAENDADCSMAMPHKKSVASACMLLKALSNESRLLILCQLAQGEKNVYELEQSLGIRQAALSQQLTVLRKEKLVQSERKGKYISYSVVDYTVLQIMQTLYCIYCSEKSTNFHRNEKVKDAVRLS